jgi:hydrogenase expression/formation protein HypD
MKDGRLMAEHLAAIRDAASTLGRTVTVMEVCGGHTNAIMRYGLRQLLPENVRLISGPGCPVCVSSQRDIDSIIALAAEGVPVATYGDMLRVPGSGESLEGAKAKGARVYEVYSATDAAQLALKDPALVFFGVGFETTAPMTAYLLGKGVCIYSVHKTMPAALQALVRENKRIDGFLDPGHVSAIRGLGGYRSVKVPQVVAGFTPERILRALRILLGLIRDGSTEVVNGYPEVVRQEGNTDAQRLLGEHFKVSDADWRGLGVIPSSGLEVKDDGLNARLRHADILAKVPHPKKTRCICGTILRGEAEPRDCPLFGGACTPERPQGACMVSAEGGCAIAMTFGGQDGG